MAVPARTNVGVLPHGRWRASLDEVEAAFATGQDDPRPQIWAEFAAATSALVRAGGAARVREPGRECGSG